MNLHFEDGTKLGLSIPHFEAPGLLYICAIFKAWTFFLKLKREDQTWLPLILSSTNKKHFAYIY
jgi:hypothetical protein